MFGRLRISVIQLAFPLAFFPIVSGCIHTEPTHYGLRFLVIGDWGREGKEDQTNVATAMGKTASVDNPDFIISTGDNFYEKGVSSINDTQWKASWQNIYAASSLQIPWYVSLGNHDYHTNPAAEVEYTRHSKLWNMPSRYYAVEKQLDDTTTALFLIIDTSPFITNYQLKDDEYHVNSQPPARQLAWVDSVLSHSKAKWKFAIGHHPIFSAARKHGDTPELIKDVLPIFQRYHVQAYFCGHDHNLQHLSDQGLTTYLSGGGSEFRGDLAKRDDLAFGAASTGFLEITLSSRELQAAFYNSRDSLLDVSKIYP